MGIYSSLTESFFCQGRFLFIKDFSVRDLRGRVFRLEEVKAMLKIKWWCPQGRRES